LDKEHGDNIDDDVDRPTPYPVQDKHKQTDKTLYYKVPHPNHFSPPVETEGEKDCTHVR
jgi:hypothetical protein